MKMIFKKSRTGPQSLDTQTDDSEVRNNFLIDRRELHFIVITSNQVLNSMCQRENYSQYHCDMLTWSGELVALLESHEDDHWNVDGDRNLSEPRTGFTKFTVFFEKKKKTPDGYTWPDERLTKIQATSRPDHLWPEIWSAMSKAAQRKEKQWAIEKPTLVECWKVERHLCYRSGRY